jgi:hypothetical protein
MKCARGTRNAANCSQSFITAGADTPNFKPRRYTASQGVLQELKRALTAETKKFYRGSSAEMVHAVVERQSGSGQRV